MTENNHNDIIEYANETLKNTTDRPITIDEFIKEVLNDPKITRNAHQYLLDAIEYYGTRKIFEGGEEKERYKFFDDPANNGQHAVLGHTDVLNDFVRDLRVIVNSNERMQKIILFNGPTATGKSELKRCLVNGLKAYSQTDDGKKYTFDWNLSSLTSTNDRLTYGDAESYDNVNEDEWFASPINSNPISIFPKDIRMKLNQSVNYSIPIDINIDPFSNEAYQKLKRHYGKQNVENLFSKITNEKHFRIRRYTVDETKSIGILNAEDGGSVKERLIGAWMPSMFQVLDSRGRKNPQAFSYDGVLSQGNGGVTIIEDATRHADLLLHLLNIPDEGYAKIDKKLGFDVDTVPIFISNPDLMEQHINRENNNLSMDKIHGADQMKAIKRRIFQYNIKYLTSIENEHNLIRKEISGHENMNNENNAVKLRDSLIVNDVEFSPHSIEAVAIYSIITRFMDDDNTSLSSVEKALLLDRGYVDTPKGRKNITDYDDIKLNEKDGTFGIPVTYTRDILSSLLYQSESDTYLPHELLDEMVNSFSNAPIFSDKEITVFSRKVDKVKDYIKKEQEQDIINAILYDRKASEEAISEYINNIYAWDENNEEEYDEIVLKEFEKKHLGMKDSDYTNNTPDENVIKYRQNKIIKPLNKYLWKQRNEGFKINEISLIDAPVISSLMGSYDWQDVFSTYENLDPDNWKIPSENTITKEIKDKCINTLVNEFGYTKDSAIKTSNYIFSENISSIKKHKEEL